MKPPVFIDTGYILAPVNTSDEHHAQAVVASRTVQPPFLTTEAVLAEIGNALSRSKQRALGHATIEDLRADSDVAVLLIDTSLFSRALALFGERMDKEWGLTDCISFVAMQERDLVQVLTTDRHFRQAGFVSLLAEPV